jgi:hypothetical protein
VLKDRSISIDDLDPSNIRTGKLNVPVPELGPTQPASQIEVMGDKGAAEIGSPIKPVKPEHVSVIKRLLPSPIRFDMASGRVRYFGPTTNMNVLSTTDPNSDLEQRQTHWPIGLLLRDLSPEAHNYLMDLFWTCHNSVIHLVHFDAFYLDQERGASQFYSTFLHITMLATGYRYADKSRPGIQQLALKGPIMSTLHEKAKAMATLEIERPGGIPLIQAFSLLGALEFYSGRDDTGWVYTG